MLSWLTKRIAEIVFITPVVWILSYLFEFFEQLEAFEKLLASLYVSVLFSLYGLYALFSAIFHRSLSSMKPKASAVAAAYTFTACYTFAAIIFNANNILGMGAIPVGISGAFVVFCVQYGSRKFSIKG